MEHNTNTVNNKNKYIIGGVIAAVLIVAIILVAVFISKNESTITDENLENDTYQVSANLYVSSILKGEGVLKKAGYLYRIYNSDEVMNTYSNYIGREFLNSLTVSDIDGNNIEIVPGTKRILIFTEGDKEYYEDYKGYLYLGALAKDVGAYDLYVINTKKDTMGDFVDNFNGHLLNNPTPEVIEFLETYPSDFVLFINEENMIECITSLLDVNEISAGGGYVFSTYYNSHEYIRLFEEYEKDPIAATEEYFKNMENADSGVLEFENISEINNAYNLNFYEIDAGTVLNEEILEIVGKVTFTDNLYISSSFENGEGRKFHIQQGINNNSIVLLPEDFNYYSSITTDDLTRILVYGENQENITNFTFSKTNIKVHIYSDKGWTKEEVKLIVDNF